MTPTPIGGSDRRRSHTATDSPTPNDIKPTLSPAHTIRPGDLIDHDGSWQAVTVVRPMRGGRVRFAIGPEVIEVRTTDQLAVVRRAALRRRPAR